MQGWGGSCKSGVGWVMQDWVDHIGVVWSCRGWGWIMDGWVGNVRGGMGYSCKSGVGHAGVGWGGSCRSGVGWAMYYYYPGCTVFLCTQSEQCQFVRKLMRFNQNTFGLFK